MILIAAVNNSWGIGAENDLLYHIPRDMKFFRGKTKDNIIIIGRKTLESFPNGAPLKYRDNIVLTRDSSYMAEGAVICNNISAVSDYIGSHKDKEVFVCGGAEIYRLLLPYCSLAYITKIYDDKQAEKFMPNLDIENGWVLEETSEEYNEDGYSFRFCTYKNTNPVTLK